MRSGGMSGRIGGSGISADGGGGGGVGDTNNGCSRIVGSDVGGSNGAGIGGVAGFALRTSGSYGDTRCLLDGEYYR